MKAFLKEVLAQTILRDKKTVNQKTKHFSDYQLAMVCIATTRRCVMSATAAAAAGT